MIKRTYPYYEIYPLYSLLGGGNVGESNPPNPLTDIGHRIGYIDFEDQEGHQTSTAPSLHYQFSSGGFLSDVAMSIIHVMIRVK